MDSTLISILAAACLVGAVLIGRLVRPFLREHHLNSETKDAVKLAMGLVATMAALLLGLLVSSAKGSYDTTRTQVLQLSSKLSFLDRVLEAYGPETSPLRIAVRSAVVDAVNAIWMNGQPARSAHHQAGDALYYAIQHLPAQNESQRALKSVAAGVAIDIAQIRSQLHAQSLSSISIPLLTVVVAWLSIIFFSFSLLAPPNSVATLALLVSTLCVTGAIFLILELDSPFSGVVKLSSEPLRNALEEPVN